MALVFPACRDMPAGQYRAAAADPRGDHTICDVVGGIFWQRAYRVAVEARSDPRFWPCNMSHPSRVGR